MTDYRKKTVWLSAAIAVLVVIILALLWIVTRGAAEDASPMPAPTVPTAANPAIGIKVTPADSVGVSYKLEAAGIPYVVIDSTTFGINPDNVDKAKAVIANSEEYGKAVGFEIVSTNIEEPQATILQPEPTETTRPSPSASPSESASEAPPVPEVPENVVPMVDPNGMNQSEIEFLPNGTIDEMNPNWSLQSTLANSNWPAIFIQFNSAEAAKAAEDWLMATAQLNNGYEASLLSPTTNPLIWMSRYELPADLQSSLVNAVGGNLTIETGTGLSFSVETSLNDSKANALAKTLPLPMAVGGPPSSALLQYMGPVPTKQQFNDLGKALKAAGISDPTAIGFN